MNKLFFSQALFVNFIGFHTYAIIAYLENLITNRTKIKMDLYMDKYKRIKSLPRKKRNLLRTDHLKYVSHYQYRI